MERNDILVAKLVAFFPTLFDEIVEHHLFEAVPVEALCEIRYIQIQILVSFLAP